MRRGKVPVGLDKEILKHSTVLGGVLWAQAGDFRA
jgi:hypothetical protein